MPHKSKKKAIAKARREAEAALIAAGGDPSKVGELQPNLSASSDIKTVVIQNGVVDKDDGAAVGNKGGDRLDNGAGAKVVGAGVGTAPLFGHPPVAKPAVLSFASAVKAAPTRPVVNANSGAPSASSTKVQQLTKYTAVSNKQPIAPTAAVETKVPTKNIVINHNPPPTTVPVNKLPPKHLVVKTASNIKTTPNITIKNTTEQEAAVCLLSPKEEKETDREALQVAHTLLELRGQKSTSSAVKTKNETAEAAKKALEASRKGGGEDMMFFGEVAVPRKGSVSIVTAPTIAKVEVAEPSVVTETTPTTTVEETVEETVDNNVEGDSKSTVESTDDKINEAEEKAKVTEKEQSPKPLTEADLIHLLRRLITSVPVTAPLTDFATTPGAATPTDILPHLTLLTTNLSCFLNLLPRDEASQPLRTELCKYLLRTSILYHQISHTAGTSIDRILASLSCQKGFMKTLMDEVTSFRSDPVVVNGIETMFKLDPQSQAGHCPFGCRDLQLSERVVVEVEKVVLRPAEMIDAPEDVVVSLEEAIAELEKKGVCMKKPERVAGVAGAEGVLGTFGHAPPVKKTEGAEGGEGEEEAEELPADYEARAWKQARKLRQKGLKKEMKRIEREAREAAINGISPPAAPAAAVNSAANAPKFTLPEAGKPMSYAQLAARAANVAAAMASSSVPNGGVTKPATATPTGVSAVIKSAPSKPAVGATAVARGLPASTPTGPAAAIKSAAATPAEAAVGVIKSTVPGAAPNSTVGTPAAVVKPATTPAGFPAVTRPAVGAEVSSRTPVGQISTLSQAMDAAKEEAEKKVGQEKLSPEEIRKRARRAKMKAREREGKNQRREAMARLLSEDGKNGGVGAEGAWGGVGML